MGLRGVQGKSAVQGNPSDRCLDGAAFCSGVGLRARPGHRGLQGKARDAEERVAGHQEDLKVKFAHPFMLPFSQNLLSIYHGTARNKTEPYPPGADIPAGRWTICIDI